MMMLGRRIGHYEDLTGRKITRRRQRRYRRWYNRTVRYESRALGWPEKLSAHGVRVHIMPRDIESWDPGAEREATTGRRAPGAQTVFVQPGGDR